MLEKYNVFVRKNFSIEIIHKKMFLLTCFDLYLVILYFSIFIERFRLKQKKSGLTGRGQKWKVFDTNPISKK